MADSPRPLPEVLVVKKGSKIRSIRSGVMPQPVSLTSTVAKRPGFRVWFAKVRAM